LYAGGRLAQDCLKLSPSVVPNMVGGAAMPQFAHPSQQTIKNRAFPAYFFLVCPLSLYQAVSE
jgi:hypothetical protein